MNISIHPILKNISRTVWILSLISLFTDTASEIYPIMPIYLKSGFSIVLIGILEGVAEAAGLSKGYFGALGCDGKESPFVQLGYTFSAISNP
jgi:hypothetical protein